MKNSIPTWYYQQFDADYSLAHPGEGYGGWQKSELPLNPEKTAVVLMHAWDNGTYAQYPGWYRAVEYIPRAYKICTELLPPFLKEVRESSLKLFHVASPNQVLGKYPGYASTAALAGEEPRLPRIAPDATLEELHRFRSEHVFVGTHNAEDVRNGQRELDFFPTVRPVGNEPVACTSHQLYSLCREYGINHLIYTGFAVNMCLTVSPGGFVDLSRYGVMCSIVRDLTTAVENKETCRLELNKAYGLWQFAILSGFVYDLNDITDYIQNNKP